MHTSESRASERRTVSAVPDVTPLREELLDIIARAAAPHERATLSCFGVPRRPMTDRTVAQREDEWIRLLTRGDREAFVELLATRGLDLAAARRGLAEVEVTDATTLPMWARDVLSLFSEDAPGREGHGDEPVPTFALGELTDAHALKLLSADPAAPWSLHRAFEPQVRRGAAYLRTLVENSPVPISAKAQRQLLATLAQRLSGPCSTLLFHRLTAADTIVDHTGVVGQTIHVALFGDDVPLLHQWLRLFRTYPVLARVIAVADRNWRETTAELIARLGRDRERLQAAFGSGPLGALTECSMGAGDSHDRGRTVTILAFESGTRVVYKPKDLRIATAYMSLVTQLNAGGLEPALPTRQIVEGDGYGWEAFVAEAGCATIVEVHRFYVQMGMHVRLIQLLDGMDFTGDNVIAGGDFPALVDLEALLAPRVPVLGRQSSGADEAMTRAFESPVRGCLITAKILGERGRQAAELGALAPFTECIAPFKQRVVRRTDDGPMLVDVYPEFPVGRAAPTWNGERMQSTDYFDDVVTGYVQMGEHLRRLHHVLAGEASPLPSMRDVLVRCLCRDTHVYARMLQSSLTPARLRDGVDRELCLERMWKARFPNPAVVAAEIESLRDLDIPMFASRPGSTPLLKEGVVLVEDFFAGTASDRLAERVSALPSSTREHDRELIESVLFTLAPSVRRRAAATARKPRAGAPDWLSTAERVGSEIVATAISTAQEPKWIGGNYLPWSGCWVFSVVADDLYTGAAGVGLVLAELASATGSPRFASVASATLRGISKRLSRVYTQQLADPSAQPPGAIFGWGGRVYACDRASRLLADDSIREGSDGLFGALGQSDETQLSNLLTRAGVWDVGTGAAGLLLVALATGAGGDADRAVIASAAGRLLSARAPGDDEDPPVYPPGTYPRGIMGARVGMALARARWRKHSGALGGAESMIEVPALSASPPTPGDLIGLLSAVRAGASARTALWHSVDEALSRAVDDGDGLGWLERGEVALAAYAAARDARYLAVAQDAGERLHSLKDRTGRWLPECMLADRHNLSAIVGLGAVGHFFLQLATPGHVRSIRTLE